MEPTLPDASLLLPRSFFAREPRVVAREVLGCPLVSRKAGALTGGVIVETEAYLGTDDPGSHASTRGITKRNAVMYGPPGHAYVYFTYGNHHMLNFVCEPEGTAGAVLVRAVRPLWGIGEMTRRRGGRTLGELANGPGKLTAALAIDLSDNACPLNEMGIFVYDAPRVVDAQVVATGRVGLSNGHEHEYRYHLRDDPFVSRGRTGPCPSSVRRKNRSQT
ncbi:MAG: DNA-3-methyladenine glycosylase [Anaerosomatales bacterium]|nr:DNA-3-methyladenine glycosylase [Anaerosomatales bacterium]MDT8434848.1 DNA-3-methyladenine glycosylase [Anaerosomatales bacterium]